MTAGSARLGTVYLMYNAASGYNCVTTIKSQYVGVATWTWAELDVQNSEAEVQAYNYLYYAAVERYARGRCVQYECIISAPNDSQVAKGGRSTWGNCG